MFEDIFGDVLELPSKLKNKNTQYKDRVIGNGLLACDFGSLLVIRMFLLVIAGPYLNDVGLINVCML